MDWIETIYQNIDTILTFVFLTILSVISILEVLDMYGLEIKWCKYSQKKRARERKQIEIVVDEYINNKKNLFMANTNEHIDYLLASMGIKKVQKEELISSIDELKQVNRVITSVEEMEESIKSLLKDPRVLLDLTKTDPGRKVIYSGLKYYINFTDTINIKSINGRVLPILHFYIEKVLSEMGLSVRDIDRLVIPTESNVIMGIELANLLDIEPIIMHDKKRRIYDDQYWDGTLPSGSRLLIFHDVIFSGDNIVDCIQRLPKSCAIVGVTALINRTDKDKQSPGKIGKSLIVKETGVDVYSAIDVNDEFLSHLLQENAD